MNQVSENDIVENAHQVYSSDDELEEIPDPEMLEDAMACAREFRTYDMPLEKVE